MNKWIDAIGQTIFYIALYLASTILSPYILKLAGMDPDLISQIIASSLLFTLAVLLINKDKVAKKGWFTGFTKRELGRTLELCVAAIILVNFFVVYLFPGFIEVYMPDALKEQFQSIAEGSPWLALFAVGIAAPLAEEVLFRGAIYNLLNEKFNKYAAVGVSSILFALIHLNIYQASYTLFVGLFMGIIIMKTGSLWLAVIFHIVYNIFGSIFGAFDSRLMELLFTRTYILPAAAVLLTIHSLKYFLGKGARRK